MNQGKTASDAGILDEARASDAQGLAADEIARHPASLTAAGVEAAFEAWWASDEAQGQLSYDDRPAARVAFEAGLRTARG